MQLFGSYTSPFVRHIRVILSEMGFDYEFIETSFQSSAEQSPTKKVPFFKDGDTTLSDSSSIVRYLREKAGQAFMSSVDQYDLYCLINTLADSAINLFILELHQLDTSKNPYFSRQRERIEDGLNYLDGLTLKKENLDKDTYWRLVCFLAYGLFRELFTLENKSQLQALLSEASSNLAFSDTKPPVS